MILLSDCTICLSMVALVKAFEQAADMTLSVVSIVGSSGSISCFEFFQCIAVLFCYTSFTFVISGHRLHSLDAFLERRVPYFASWCFVASLPFLCLLFQRVLTVFGSQRSNNLLILSHWLLTFESASARMRFFFVVHMFLSCTPCFLACVIICHTGCASISICCSIST